MRDTKFRAWDKTKKEMTYKVTVGNTDESDENYTCPSIYVPKIGWLNADKACIDVMQSLGRKDINGKEIYEGDIFEISDGNCFIRYDVATASFEAVFEDEAVVSFWEATSWGNDKIEVIGNIYENKDLLGG